MMFLFYFQEAKDRGKHIIAHTVGKAVTLKDAEGASMTLETTPLSDVTLSKDSILFFGKALFVMTSYIRRCIKGVFPLPDSYSDSYSTGSTGTDSDGHSDAKSQWKLVKFHLIGTDIGVKLGTVPI